MTQDIPGKRIIGYLDPFSVRPGDSVQVKVSSESQRPYHASLVQLLSGDSRSHGTGYRELPVPSALQGTYPSRTQAIIPGSFAELGTLPAGHLRALTFWCLPTLPDRHQVVLSGPGFQIAIVDERLSLTTSAQTITLATRLRTKRWHRIGVALDAETLTLSCEIRPLGIGESVRSEHRSIPVADAMDVAGDWLLATANPGSGGSFNGRIDQLHIQVESGAGYDWNFAQNFASERFTDSTGTIQGQFHQQPTRAVKGERWDGSVQDWKQNPGHYSAVHFHEDDLTDAAWATDFAFKIPADLASGLYCVKVVTEEGDEDLMPVFVAPSADGPKQKVAVLMSTATYLAYANQRMSISGDQFGRGVRNASDKYLVDHPEVGNSLYEHNLDGSGVHFSSRRRPIVNLKPKTLTWSFNADTNLIAWLHAINQPFDVITDEQLHLEGSALLQDYMVVITGTHPEYHSTPMLDAITRWMNQGGRLMYMGGNGFYWRIAHHPEDPAIIEVRRAEDGTRAWMADAGEYYHQFTGEYGGLWLRLGRSPNQLVGVGFTAQGFDGGTYYRITDAASDPRAAFITDGIHTELIGQHGTQGGGAAGEEIDRYDKSLGSPPHALVVASSEAHRPGMLVTKEEFLMTVPEPKGSKVRADMTFFETEAGGAVFSTGSISYAGSLSTNYYDNDISRVTGNVLQRFLDTTPFSLPSGDLPE